MSLSKLTVNPWSLYPYKLIYKLCYCVCWELNRKQQHNSLWNWTIDTAFGYHITDLIKQKNRKILINKWNTKSCWNAYWFWHYYWYHTIFSIKCLSCFPDSHFKTLFWYKLFYCSTNQIHVLAIHQLKFIYTCTCFYLAHKSSSKSNVFQNIFMHIIKLLFLYFS